MTKKSISLRQNDIDLQFGLQISNETHDARNELISGFWNIKTCH